jgi:peptidylprolyl isomerase
VEIDSTDDHRTPQLDKDHKPVVDANGKPVLGDPQPMPVVMGQGRPLPGWDMGFEGMKAGGTRRIYIPWQLGLGARDMPARDPKHSAVPAKTDLILEVELKEVTDAPPPPQHPGMMPGMRPGTGGQPMSPRPGAPGAPGAPMQMMVTPKPVAPPPPGAAPNAAAPAMPVAPAAPPATTPAVPPTPAPPPAK